jgi:hypothetical protein
MGLKNSSNNKQYLCAFFHPDFTVGSGTTPDQPLRLAGFTAGQELKELLSHLAPKAIMNFIEVLSST